ncbi:DUF6194 family protein [Streptomonospora wellingtoniae]|uniref:DUF6194 family protein n=1 Tax=Streptomonospora wellingtoniae TaxID=3075544 RepID=A0ABU2KTB8_9ACTN|nr:DUF6194 family protein [Streptomonospora sp. DSM 45055]MDT0302540.1 DUF6194 family protein [Streptomonospora sp. DSM 45055]
MNDIIEHVRAMDGVLVLEPREGDGTPEIAWGDVFFYYAPDGVVPRSQPFATVVTKDYPDDTASRLDRPGFFRVNVAAGAEGFRRWTGHGPKEPPPPGADPSAADTVCAHPLYAGLSWLAVVNPGPRTAEAVEELLATAHHRARERFERRAPSGRGSGR